MVIKMNSNFFTYLFVRSFTLMIAIKNLKQLSLKSLLRNYCFRVSNLKPDIEKPMIEEVTPRLFFKVYPDLIDRVYKKSSHFGFYFPDKSNITEGKYDHLFSIKPQYRYSQIPFRFLSLNPNIITSDVCHYMNNCWKLLE